MSQTPVLTVSEFVAIFNQTLEYAYPVIVVEGELTNFRISKNRWIYFDLKDESASIKCFGTVYQLPGPLEDGLLLQVQAVPRLHPQYGFSMNVQYIKPVGIGSLVRAAALLEAKLRAEGLFDETRKRTIPYPPQRVGLITSGESAAYLDFIKIIGERWGGVEILLADVQVQGDGALVQLVSAMDYFNAHERPVDVIVMTRGGGNAEDLAVFNDERLVRTVSTSRIPTLVAIGHEVDVSLAELAADKRASTPSNAAEILVPDKHSVLQDIATTSKTLTGLLMQNLRSQELAVREYVQKLQSGVKQILRVAQDNIDTRQRVLAALNPATTLARGYSVIRLNGRVITTVKSLHYGDGIRIELHDGYADANVTSTRGH